MVDEKKSHPIDWEKIFDRAPEAIAIVDTRYRFEWVNRAMEVFLELPREEIQGNYGFVEFWFEKTEMDHVIVRVPVQLYINNARDVTGTALFRMFHNFP